MKRQKMGSLERESGVLKLVHPGRYVEIHKRPMTAAEVLKKNPRHSVTRSDVFKYPWVVVKPESVLNLGKVFFIVPNHTIYHLLKASGHRYQHPAHCSQAPKYGGQGQKSPRKSEAGMNPKHPNHHKWFKLSLPAMSCIWPTFQEQDCDDRLRIQSKVNDTPEVIIPKFKKMCLEYSDKTVEDSRNKIQSAQQKRHHFTDINIPAELPEDKDENSEFEWSREVTVLKSCLRKHDSDRKSLPLRVTFSLPEENEEQQRRVELSRIELPSYYSSAFTGFLCPSSKHYPGLI